MLPPMDDRTVGLAPRALRHRRGLRQGDLAVAAGVSQATVSRVETGHVAESTVAVLRRLFWVVDARIQRTPGWRGADLDRLLDADHAVIGSAAASRLEALGWSVDVEVTDSESGERGSIDLLGVPP